ERGGHVHRDAGVGRLLGGGRRVRRRLGREVAGIDPGRNANPSKRRLGFSLAEVDVGLQRVERDATFAVPLHAGHLRATETPANSDLHPLRAGAHRLHQRLLDGTPEGDTLLELGRDVLGYQLGAELRLLDLLDRHPDPLAGGLLQLVTELIDARPALADHDARLGGVQRDRQRRRRALGLDAGNAGILEAGHQHPAETDVLEQQRLLLLVRNKPLPLPVTVDAQPEAVRVNFMSHYLPFFSLVSFLSLPSARARVVFASGFVLVLGSPFLPGVAGFDASALGSALPRFGLAGACGSSDSVVAGWIAAAARAAAVALLVGVVRAAGCG